MIRVIYCPECQSGEPHKIPVEAFYGAPCRCGRGFLARLDSSLCEWCTAAEKRRTP
jgi:hypothetical protein